MKLSEKMCKGQEMMPQLSQCTGMFFKRESDEDITQACAYGFAAIGEEGLRMVGETPSDYFSRVVKKANEISKGRGVSEFSIVHMNDHLRLTVSQIVNELERKGY